MHDIVCFLSMAAGRSQGVDHISIATTTMVYEDIPESLTIHPSFKTKANLKTTDHQPHPADLPLDPVNRPDEFKTVLANWVARQPSWQVARTRYLGCMRKANNYDSERLVAAANMFDILPADAVPSSTELSEELALAKEKCIGIFRSLPKSIDRDSALSALGRLGQSSLPKKVAHRVKIIEAKLGERFPDLQYVASIAVKRRNFFVHGSSYGIDHSKLEEFVPFLTDALEFIFSASDFIEAGWDAATWKSGGWGHNFARFRSNYNEELAAFQLAMGQASA
jgi:hypothetical protein